MRQILAGLLLASALMACSASPQKVRADYCDVVEEQQFALTEALAVDTPDALLEALPLFRELAEEAPRDIDDDWTRFIDALGGLQKVLDAAGVEAASYDAKQPPEEVTAEQQADIARAADELVQSEVSAAFEGVQQQAKDVCGTPLYQ
ncbi:MAG: hypothetical protein ACXWDL_06200 [Nocardioides sp.]